MKLDQLRRMALFAMVAQEGSFTAVSNQQNIATSAISSAISQLEKEIGTRLLHRSTRKISLTDEGRGFLQRCQAMLFEANAAHEELHQRTGQLVGQLTITASQMEAECIVLPALTPLLQAHRQLTLNLMINDFQVDMVSNGIDLAIRGGAMHDSTLIARALAELPEVIVAAPQYIQQYGRPNSIETLMQHRIIAFLPFAQPNHLTLLDAHKNTHSVALMVGAKTNSVKSVKQLSQMGLGLARLPRTVVEQELQEGTLVEVLTDYTLPKVQIYAVTIKRDLQPSKVTAALAALHDYLRDKKL